MDASHRYNPYRSYEDVPQSSNLEAPVQLPSRSRTTAPQSTSNKFFAANGDHGRLREGSAAIAAEINTSRREVIEIIDVDEHSKPSPVPGGFIDLYDSDDDGDDDIFTGGLDLPHRPTKRLKYGRSQNSKQEQSDSFKVEAYESLSVKFTEHRNNPYARTSNQQGQVVGKIRAKQTGKKPTVTAGRGIRKAGANDGEATVNDEQRAAAGKVFKGQNTFLTGAAGTGKSFLLRHIIKGFKQRFASYGKDTKIAITASTGIAATHIDGVTIHSWAGIGLGKGGPDKLVEKVMSNRLARKRWNDADVLIIDEVSMLDGTLFDSLDLVGRSARGRSSQPFGGLQLLLCGDFFQLPPVSLRSSKFAFRSSAWASANIQTIELTRVARQAGDSQFIDLLGQVRVGKCPASASDVLSKCHVSRKAPPGDGIEPTKLYCTNKNVDAENNTRLSQLAGDVKSFPAKDVFKGNYSPGLQSNLRGIIEKKSPEVIRLKIGAQVILTRNMMDRNLVNGSRGVVVGFESDLSDDIGVESLFCDYPRVQFTNGEQMLVKPESTTHSGPGGSIVRIQLPLKLAWCLTVHKSQGMTLDRAELQLEDAFDYGQVYVALSRVTSLDGLWIRGKMLSQSIVKAHPHVSSFYGKL